MTFTLCYCSLRDHILYLTMVAPPLNLKTFIPALSAFHSCILPFPLSSSPPPSSFLFLSSLENIVRHFTFSVANTFTTTINNNNGTWNYFIYPSVRSLSTSPMKSFWILTFQRIPMKTVPAFTFLLTILQQYSWAVNLSPFSQRQWRISDVNSISSWSLPYELIDSGIQPHIHFFNYRRKGELSILDLLIYLGPVLSFPPSQNHVISHRWS